MGLYDIPSSDDKVVGRKYPDSVKSAVQTWTHVIPVNQQLAVAGTAEDVFNVRTASAHATRNIVTNPSMETGDPPTGYTAVGSTLSQQATPVQFGSNNMRVITDNAAAGEGFYWQLAVNPTPVRDRQDDGYTFSVYLRGNAGTETVRIRYWNATDGYLVSGPVVTLSGAAYTRYVLPKAKPTVSATTRLYVETDVQQAATFFADGMQFEHYGFASQYADGAQGNLYDWEGTAHASTSIRHSPVAEIRGFDLSFDLDTYVQFDGAATSVSVPISAGSSWSIEHPLAVRRISILNQTGGERPTVTGALYAVMLTDVGGE